MELLDAIKLARSSGFVVIVSHWFTTVSIIGLQWQFIHYLESLHIGLIGWGIDSNYGKLVKDHSKYEPTDYSSFTGCTKTPSEAGGGRFLANYPND